VGGDGGRGNKATKYVGYFTPTLTLPHQGGGEKRVAFFKVFLKYDTIYLQIQPCSPRSASMGQLPKIAGGINNCDHAFFLHFFIDKRLAAI
jgi:hypothetical protein